MARCLACKGLGKVNGMGGLQRDCKACDGVGKVESKPIVDSVDILEKPVDKTPEIVHVEMAASAAIDEQSSKQTLPKKKEAAVVETLDEITLACIEEQRMDPIAWKQKYQHVEGLFAKSMITGQMEEIISKVERAAIRTSYAMQTPAAPRIVDLNKAQDAAGKSDPDYIAYQNKEKARLKKEASKK